MDVKYTTLSVQVRNEKTGQTRTSELDICKCFRISIGTLYPIDVPLDPKDTAYYLGQSKAYNLQGTYNEGKTSLTMETYGILHTRRVNWNLIKDYVTDTFFDLRPYLRYSSDGHVEFMHPLAPPKDPFWSTLADIGRFLQPAMESQYDPCDEAIKALGSYVNRTDGIDNGKIEGFLDNCYIDNGRIIRRGT